MGYTVATRSFIGKGPIYLRPRNGGAMRAFGNASEASFAIEKETKELLDYTQSGGGVKDSLSRITKVTGTTKVHDYSPENLALGLRGTVRDIAADAVVDEPQTAYPLSFIPFDYIPDLDQPITVTAGVSAAWQAATVYAVGDQIVDNGRLYGVTVAGTSGGSAPAWPTDGTTVVDNEVTWQDQGETALSLGVHFTQQRGGVQLLAAAPVSTSGTPVKISYTQHLAAVIEALISSGEEYLMYWDGLNEVDSDNPVTVRAHRIKFEPTAGLSLIGDDFGEMDLEFQVLSDSTITDPGLSKFLQIGVVK